MTRTSSIYLSACALFIFALSATTSRAQTAKKDSTKNTSITEEIVVERAYKPVLADAVKIRRSPDLDNNKPFRPNLTYTILDKKLELNTDIRRLQAQQLAEEKAPVLTNNYVKAGAGNLNTGLAEVYLNTGKDEALQAGMFIKHLNQSGDEIGQKFSRQQVGAFGKSIQEQFTLNGSVGYERRSTNFYGFDPVLLPASASPQKQTFNVLSLTGELLKRASDTDNGVNYAAKTDAYLFRNAFEGRENAFAASGYLSKSYGAFNFGANASVDFTGVKDSSATISNNIARINPHVKFEGKNYKLTIGLNLVQEFGTESRTSLLPAVTAEVQLVPDFAALFGGYTGDVLKTSLLDLSNENPFLNKDILVKNALEKSKIFGGIKGNAGTGFGYKATAYYKTIEDMPLFINNMTNKRKFDVVYDQRAKVFGIEGEISVKAADFLTWTGTITAQDYNLKSEQEAWFKPGMQFVSQVALMINKKLTIDGEILLHADSKALTYPAASPDPVITTVKSFADLGVGGEYRIKEKIGVYIRANNLFGTNYQRYLYYPSMGTTVFGGLNYSF